MITTGYRHTALLYSNRKLTSGGTYRLQVGTSRRTFPTFLIEDGADVLSFVITITFVFVQSYSHIQYMLYAHTMPYMYRTL